jgi:hypothetical protein
VVTVIGVAFGVACGGGDDDGVRSSGGAAETGTGGSSSGSGGSAAGAGGSNVSGTGGTSGADGAVPVEEFAQAYARALCAYNRRCNPLFSASYASLEECIDYSVLVLGSLSAHGLEPAVERGTIEYDAAGVSECLATLENASCESAFDGETCGEMAVGLLEQGDSCLVSAECAEGLFCETLTCPGACTQRREEGAACEEPAECLEGLRCFLGECATPTAAGAPCDSSAAPCVSGYTCLTGDDGVDRCSPISAITARAIGEPCEVGSYGLCVEGAYCAFSRSETGVSGRCAPRVASGEACQFGLPDACPSGQYCNADTEGDLSGRCEPRLALGDACTSSVGCPALEATCVGGSCRTWAVIGEACVDDAQCITGGPCENGFCAAPECAE